MTDERRTGSETDVGVLIDGKYRLLEEIGQGGMGTVFRAHDVTLDRTVAIKFLRPELQADGAFLERFRREAKAMAKVRHENVLQIFAYGVAHDVAYFVMEYIDGRTLEQLLNQLAERRAYMPLDDAIRLLEQAAAGLAAIHAADVVHRDIKPSNILVTSSDGRAVIMDFGIGRRVSQGDSEASAKPMGTPAYMAPEIVLGERLPDCKRHLSDIYAFGITAFELLTGTLPFDSEKWIELFSQHIEGEPPAPSSRRADVPPELDALVLKCLEKKPSLRFQSGDEIQRALKEYREARAASPAPKDRAVSGILHTPTRASTVPPPRRSAVQPSGARVIVAAASSADRYALYPYITDAFPGCQFVAAKTNASALEMSRADPPALLVARLEDETMNGVELAASLRGDHVLDEVHLVLLAERVTASESRMLEQLGVFRVVLSPPEEAEIVELLDELADRISGTLARPPSQSAG